MNIQRRIYISVVLFYSEYLKSKFRVFWGLWSNMQCRTKASGGRQSPWPFRRHGSERSSFLFTQTRPTLTLTCRALHQTARMNWWVSIRRRSLVPKASGEEPKQLLILNAQEVLGGTTDRSTAVWLLIMMATAAKPQLTMVRSVGFSRGGAHLLTVQWD